MPYDPSFLSTPIPVPTVPGGPTGPSGPSGPGEAPVLDYTHFTVAMNPERRLAWWSAWNIDGLTLFPGDDISRSGQSFRLDDRLPASQQTGEAAYADNRLDRGHIARRADLLWGTLAEAERANAESFTFTNITPQMDDFNQSGRGGIWGLLENAVLDQKGLTDRRVSLFAGPVLAEGDPEYRGLVRLPRQHWKAVMYRLDGQLRCKTFLLAQTLDPDAMPSYLDEFRTFEVTVDDLESRTGLAMPGLRGLPGSEVADPDTGDAMPAREVASRDHLVW